MPDTQPKPRRRLRRILWITAGVFLLWLIFSGWFMTTATFQSWLRKRVISSIADSTGGRVELGSLHTTPFRLRVDARNLTIHGTEPSGSEPLFHAERVVADFRIVSLLRWNFGVESLHVEAPQVHVIVAPDGSTNIPEPPGPRSNQPAIAQLVDAAIGKLTVDRGQLLWNQDRVPLEFTASGVNLEMLHALFRRRYEGKLHIGKVDTKLSDLRPFSWSADLEFTLTRNHLEVKSLNATSGRSRLYFAGDVTNFASPEVQGKYDTQIYLSEAGSILRRSELQGGIASFNGEGKWAATAFSTNGKLTVRDITIQSEGRTVRNATLTTPYRVTDREIDLRDFQVRAFAGTIAGDLQVADWQASPSTASRRNGDVEKGTLRLRLSDLAVGDLAPWLASRDLPLARLHLAGNASGSVESKWTGSPDRADSIVSLDIAPPARAFEPSLPLSGKIRAVYHGTSSQLELAQLALATRSTRVEASGTLGSSSGNLIISADSGNLAEWEPILMAFRGTAGLPVRISGAGSFGGYLTGSVREPRVNGKLQLHEFETVFVNPKGQPSRRVHWNDLACDVQASRQGIVAHHGTLRRGNMTASFDGQVALLNGELLPQSSIAANIIVQNAEISDLLSIAAYDVPISGTANLNVRITGTRGSPTGGGELHITNARVYGEDVRSIDSRIRLAGSEIRFEDADILYGSAKARGNFAYDYDHRTFRASADGSNIDLASLPKIRDLRTPIDGRLQFHAQASGTLEEPRIEAHAEVPDLQIGDEPEGALVFDATTQGSRLHLTGHADAGERHLTLQGDVDLRGDWQGSAKVDFARLDIDPILRRYLRGRVTGHSSVDGHIEASGPFRRPLQLEGSGELTQWSVGLSNVQLANDGPIRFHVANETLRLEPFRLKGEGTSLSARGTIQLSGERRLDLTADGQINLALLQTVNPEITSSGSLRASARIIGTTAEPSIQGKVFVENGNIAFSDPPLGLSDINGTLVFNQDKLQIEQLTGRSGGGLVNLGGYLQYGRYLEFNLTAKGDDIRLRYPQGMSSTASADLRLAGTSSGATLSGELVVSRFALNPGFDFSTYLARSRLSAFSPESDSPLNRLKFDIHILTSPELSMSSSLGKVSGDADLRLRGTPGKPVLLGRASIQEGEIYFNGGKYKLERGDISFTNPVKIDPVLDLSATTRVRDYDIDIKFNGSVNSPDGLRVRYTSEPPLPEADIIALLALGRTQEESARLGGSQSAFTQEASNAILGQAINATVSSRVQKLFGISRIKIDPQSPGTETSSIDRGPQVTIEQQVSNRLTLTYVQPVSQATQQTIQGELQVTRNVSLVAVRDQNGVFAFDIRIRQRKK